MKIEFYCPLWGSEELSFSEFSRKAVSAGYDGVEMSFPLGHETLRDERTDILKDAGLKLVAQHWETENPDPKDHAIEYEKRLYFLAAANPEFISSQTGRDFFEFEDNLALLAVAARVSEETGITIFHETHRSKMSFAAHITRRFLEKLPNMNLTLDVSHWFCVHERFLADQPDALSLAITRTRHIHARVGFDQGSQVPDYRAPEWQEAVEHHLKVWDRIVAQAQKENRERLTITPEFGPRPYLPIHPYTAEPLADQWELNVSMMKLLRERYS